MPLVDDAEQEDVQVGLAELPVGAVQCQAPRPRHPEQYDDAPGEVGVGQFKEPEEALELLVLRFLRGFPGKGAGDLDQVDVLDRDQCEDKGGDKLDPGAVPR